MRARNLIAVFALCFFGASAAHAAGFANASQGAGALGIAGAATARLDLPEIGFYNPAAWGLTPGFQGSVGATTIKASVVHRDVAGTATAADTPVSLPPYLFAGYTIETDIGNLAFGISGGIPFGSGLSWPDSDWPGRFEITEIALTAYELGGTVAYSPDFLPELSVAVGLRYLRSTVRLRKQVDAVVSEGNVTIGGEASGMGAQVALAYRPYKEMMLGLTYRSRASLVYSGGAHFEDVPIELSSKAHDGDVTTAITFPDRFALGWAYEHDNGTVSIDLEYTLWSTFQELAINFVDPATPDVVQDRRWSDTIAIHMGYERRNLLFDGLALRGGFAWDQSPSPKDTLSPSSPDADRLLTTIGVGYELFDWGIAVNASYAHVFFLGAVVTGSEAFPGSYDIDANLFSFGLAYRTPTQ